jgi:hypothetical protein
VYLELPQIYSIKVEKVNGKTKQKTILFLILAAGMLFLIASGLPRLILSMGMPLPEIELGQGTLAIAEQKARYVIPINELLKVVFLAILARLLFFYYKMIKQMKWKDWWFILSILLGILGVSGILFVLFYFSLHSLNSVIVKTPWPTPLQALKSPLGPAPVILLWIVGFFLAGLTAIIGYRFFTSKSRTEAGGASHLIELEALRAKEAIQSGQDFKDVITRCYRQMCLALEQERKIEREKYMTVEEFENLLESAGAPQKSVRELTRLFEDVRYGNWNPGSGEEQKAIRCFEDIIQYFRNENGGDGYEKV